MEVQPSVQRVVDTGPARPLYAAFKRLWESEEVPVDWKKYHSYLQEGQQRGCGELKAGQLSLSPL